MGLQGPCKSGQANNVYLSRDTIYILAFSLAPAPVFEKSLGFHPGDLPEAQLPPSSYAHPLSFPRGPLHLTSPALD